MRHPEVELLDDDLDHDANTPEPWDLGFSIDLLRAELDEEQPDELGLRALYERPEAILGRHGRVAA